ncbi:acetyl-CoA carboxylase biotin carboxyl carrier protein [Hymenobacter caeli]|uniref:Biotin carboxyl carrier protein of acetyl-CoA carboxylase n=1 Tax=Hymenobacter caeli TaxID=2735894 RepID=A0ABX2FWB6_9BACT|nr:acetyl-CoA carboxylase biotin carboxyl carrier protein [Hymenobacter caeli]NRT21078.1 acetyl-CoA carboxylase biotin carboxyl carrier protein [Hymenobacter caeli]
MKAKELQELLDFIAKSGLNKVNIETEEFKISVQREPNTKQVVSLSAPAPQAAPAAALAPLAPAAAPVAAAAPAAAAVHTALKAPMIGTFYRSSGPDTAAFVQVGDVVEKGQVICIIEAMKLFNEIEAEQSGRIVKALVENATPVEYDQPLFLIE